MKLFFLLIPLISFAATAADNFLQETPVLAQKLITSVMENLNAKIKEKGVAEAVPYCHGNIKRISQSAGGDDLTKYEFGRTSKRVRNANNRPTLWMENYLAQFQKNKSLTTLTHTLPDGKRVFMKPLYIGLLCLQCHGENLKADVEDKIRSLYPHDQARGYKVGDLRGMIWIKEK